MSTAQQEIIINDTITQTFIDHEAEPSDLAEFFPEWDTTPVANKMMHALSNPMQSIEQIVGEFSGNSRDAGATDFYIRTKQLNTKSLHTTIDMSFLDNGPGMTYHEMLRCFTPGSSNENKGYRTEGYKGVGFDSAAHALCEKVWAVSRQKNGTIYAAYMDFRKIGNDWKSEKFSKCYLGEEVYNNVPAKILQEWANREFGTLIYCETVHKKWGASADIIENKLRRRRTSRGKFRNSLSFVYRELIASGRFNFHVGDIKLRPSGPRFNRTIDGKARFHTYFKNDGSDGARTYSIRGPDNNLYDFICYYTLELDPDGNFSKAVNKGEKHIIRNLKEISSEKIYFKSSWQNKYNISYLHVDIHTPAKFVDSFMPLSSEKTVSSLAVVANPDYSLEKELSDAMTKDIEFIESYNEKNLLTKKQKNEEAVKEIQHIHEEIYQDRYHAYLLAQMQKSGTSDEEIKNCIRREYSPEGSLLRYDFYENGKITEMKKTADTNSLLQCLRYMASDGSRECKLISILAPTDNFYKDKALFEKHYNVEIEFLWAAEDPILNIILVKPGLTKAEEIKIKKFRKKQIRR